MIGRGMAVAALGLMAQGAMAQEDAAPWAGAIAYAQAPEQSGGVATADTVEQAIAAAVAECVAGGALEADCYVSAACEPAGWSVDIFLQHQEGPHWHEMICGIAEEATIKAMAAAVCDREARPYLIECAVVQVRDPGGAEQMGE